ncbi:hypothetical protein A1O7_01809 [Cladophialophora yegresii CBS 114405]|uniref:3-oxoacyl-[acyl-carrier protein] reductase n=1 Tax=Cladophialophora yegresii CBS 114405 TaxID=1182544 RepID=W9WC03_9EURO|nr:uncharacterized protein A1O7_01809 [Cladophialophora yegresii CBS 114405]EXJ65468.1 hypothetical protein A1O7_01809 [Cladophialophora yegresii CBS 114405]
MLPSGKVYANTGGSSGIGFATARYVSERGGTVCIADVNPVTLAEKESYFSQQSVPFMVTKVDVSNRDEVDR